LPVIRSEQDTNTLNAYSASLLPKLPLDGGGLDKPQDAEQANKQVNKWDQGFNVGSPEVWIKRLCDEKRSQSTRNDEAN
jgi:hypothetical protein